MQWDEALERFIAPWRDRDDILAAVLYGSYASGDATAKSNIDLLFLTDGSTEYPPLLEMRDGFLFEAFFLDGAGVRKFFGIHHAENSRVSAVQWTTGRILFDKEGLAAVLRVEAEAWMHKPFARPDASQAYWARRSLWQSLHHLDKLRSEGDPSLGFAEHQHLHKLYETYARFLGEPVIEPHRLGKYLSDARYRERYRMQLFPDPLFAAGMSKLVSPPSERADAGEIARLTNHAIERMGGFAVCLSSSSSSLW